MTDRNLQINLAQFLDKQVAVFGVHNSFYTCTKYLNAILFQSSVQVKLSTAVKRGLSTKCQEDAVGALLLDNLSYEVCIYRLEIHLVCNTLAGLDGCDVRVYEYTLDAFLAKCL